MTERPPASEIAATLREIREGKRLTYRKFIKARPDHWLRQYEREIFMLDFAIEGYDNLAKREGA